MSPVLGSCFTGCHLQGFWPSWCRLPFPKKPANVPAALNIKIIVKEVGLLTQHLCYCVKIWLHVQSFVPGHSLEFIRKFPGRANNRPVQIFIKKWQPKWFYVLSLSFSVFIEFLLSLEIRTLLQKAVKSLNIDQELKLGLVGVTRLLPVIWSRWIRSVWPEIKFWSLRATGCIMKLANE